MGIRFSCPNGHKLHVKEYLAGKRAVCPDCGARIIVPPADPLAPSGVTAPGSESAAVASPAVGVASNDVPKAPAAERAAADWPTIDFASQSIEIPTIDPPPAVLQSEPVPATTLAPPAPLSLAFPEVGVAAPLPPADVLPSADFLPPPEATPLVGGTARRTHSGGRGPLVIALVLTAILIVLVFVLVYVLMHGPDSQTPPEQPAAAAMMFSSESRGNDAT